MSSRTVTTEKHSITVCFRNAAEAEYSRRCEYRNLPKFPHYHSTTTVEVVPNDNPDFYFGYQTLLPDFALDYPRKATAVILTPAEFLARQPANEPPFFDTGYRTGCDFCGLESWEHGIYHDVEGQHVLCPGCSATTSGQQWVAQYSLTFAHARSQYCEEHYPERHGDVYSFKMEHSATGKLDGMVTTRYKDSDTATA
jgi:hypothetical protein